MQGTAFRLSAEEATLILGDDAPAAPTDTDDDVPVVSMLTFHPSYGYEDFVESFKPIPTPSGALTRRRTDGYFLRLCKAAAAHPDRDHPSNLSGWPRFRPSLWPRFHALPTRVRAVSGTA